MLSPPNEIVTNVGEVVTGIEADVVGVGATKGVFVDVVVAVVSADLMFPDETGVSGGEVVVVVAAAVVGGSEGGVESDFVTLVSASEEAAAGTVFGAASILTPETREEGETTIKEGRAGGGLELTECLIRTVL